MIRYWLLLLFFILNCSSAQIIKTANEDQAKIEKERTKTLLEILQDSKLTSTEKKLIQNELESKDQLIASQNKIIQAYQRETTKASNKMEALTEKSETKIEKCAENAGFGKAFKWIFIVGGGGFALYMIYLILTKTSLLSFIGIKK